MMTIKIDEEQAVDMLLERLEYWTDDCATHELYRKMYESYVYGGCFGGGEFDVMGIVDNDYINYCKIYEQGDEEFNELLRLYQEQGIGDISCECRFASYIEAVDDEEEPKAFLVRN